MARLDALRPDLRVPAITDIVVADLMQQGYRALLLDLDNTLLPWQNWDVPESSKQWILDAKQLGMKVCIVSNTHHPRRLNQISDELGIQSIARALKPRAHGFRRAAEMMGCELSASVVIGDQLFTDILGGNLAGSHTILVNPMHPREFIGTKISRGLEWIAFRLLGLQAPLGTKSNSIKSEQEDTK
jgi:HAD superfamily phosphatase (TIGR01668 family)